MAKKSDSEALVAVEQIERSIHVIRGQRVMLDFDLAKLYGIPTYVLNQAVKRNRDRFPRDFAFPLTGQELASLKSQIVMSKPGRGGRRTIPWAFTEHGVSMLASVLKSPLAVKVNIEIVRTFVRLRRLLATPGELVEQIRQLADTVQLHDGQIREIARVIQQMIEPPNPPQPTRRFGFQPPPRPDESSG